MRTLRGTRPRTRLSRLTAAIAIAAVGALAGGVEAQAAIPAGNLLQNGGAELGAGATDGSTVSPTPIPDWTTTSNFTEHAYDPSGAFPDPDVSSAIGGAGQFFAGGPAATGDNTTEAASQSVDVSAAAPEIDAGGVGATLAAALGGFESQEDNATVVATFLGSTGQALGRMTIGPVTATDRGFDTKLLPRSATAGVPPGTRAISVVITARRLEGSYNDGYVDNVALTLGSPAPSTEPGPASPPVVGPKGNPLGLPKSHGCISRSKFSFRLRHAPNSRIVSAKAFVDGKRKLSKHGHSIKRLVLKRLPKGRFMVKVDATHDTGVEFISKETYKGCKKSGRRRHHVRHHHR